ncbi:MAG: response regulator [Candidatus Omnitrophica bacterium]|nr:response regulator [Candidatus Omnitrophota bacterium]
MARARVLVCDDEEGVRRSVALVLEDEYDVVMAEDGEAVLNYLKQKQPDLLILDLKLPRMSGIETLRKIRQTDKKLPILVLTAYHSMEIAQEAIRLGAYDYIPKPFEQDHLLKAVNAGVEKSYTAQHLGVR